MGTTRAHWDAVYAAKSEADLSWHEEIPAESLRLITESCSSPP